MWLGFERRWWLLFGFFLFGTLLYLLQPILMPFLLGAAIAYLGDPLADQLEERNFSRSTAVVLVFLAFGLTSLMIFLIALPLLLDQLQLLFEQLRLLTRWVYDSGLPALRDYLGMTVEEGEDAAAIGARLTEGWQRAGSVVVQISQQLIGSGLAVSTWLINLALVPVVTFYLLRDWDLLIAGIDQHLPRSRRARIAGIAKECDEVLSAFVRGQLLVMASLGLIYSTGLWLVGLDLALVLGAVAGLASVVPYLGSIVGVIAGLIAAWAQFGDPLMLVWVLMVFGVGQMIEGMFLTPLLVGERIGLHPVAVIFAVMAGGQLFGFTGILLALPAASVIKVLINHALDKYSRSSIYIDLPPGVDAAASEPADESASAVVSPEPRDGGEQA